MAFTRRKLLIATAGLATLTIGCGSDRQEPVEPPGNLVAPPPEDETPEDPPHEEQPRPQDPPLPPGNLVAPPPDEQ